MWPTVENLNPPKNEIDKDSLVTAMYGAYMEVLDLKRCFPIDEIYYLLQKREKIDFIDEKYKDLLNKFLNSQVNEGIIEEFGRPGVYRKVGSGYDVLPDKFFLNEFKTKERRTRIIGQVDHWISITEGYFTLKDCYSTLRVTGKKEKGAVRQALHRRHIEGILERHSIKPGTYCRADQGTSSACAPISHQAVCPHCQKNIIFNISKEGE